MPALLRTGLPAAGIFLCRHRAVLLTACVGLSLSGFLFANLRDWERRETQTAVETVARQRLELLRESLGNSLEVLHGLGALFGTGLPVDRDRFRRFTASALARRPELQSLSWSPRVPAEQREAVEAAVRAEGFLDYQFVERDPVSLKLVPARRRTDYYCPIVYIEPLARNRPAFGISANLENGKAADARDSGRVVATSLIPLRQEERNEPGFVVYLPLYGGETPATQKDRRDRFSGQVIAVFRIADLVRPALARLPGMQIEIRDPQPELRSVVYAPPEADDSPRSRKLKPCALRLGVADRELTITFAPTTAFVIDRQGWQSWLMLLSGLTITGLICAYTMTSQRRNADIARANAALQLEVEERKHAEEAAAAANRAKSDFVSSLSHEIRTPLNSILGYAQILERAPSLPAEHREAVGAVGTSGRHLLGLLDSILDLSRIEAGRVEVQRVAFDLPALLNGLATMFKPRCAGKPVTLRIDCQMPAGRGAVLGDEGKLRQVLINLISNAVKFTPTGEVVIGLQPGPLPDQWQFAVRDTGIGIAPGERANLFTRFQQTAAGRRLGGTGLGLAIARGHVELMGGRLELESERGVGTRFSFTLPLAAAVLARHASPADTLPRLAAGVRVQALVVDDDRDNRHILARWLRDLGCAIAEAGTSRDARDLARNSPPDVLFLDVFLADTTGPELLAALRADGLPASTPVLMHTAALLTNEQRESLQATGADLLQKPFRIDDLCACLRRVPGVRFASPATPVAGPSCPALPDLSTVSVSEDLRERMIVAAEMHSTTVLKSCLLELRGTGGPAALLADHLRQLLRGYDLAAIAHLLREMRTVETDAHPLAWPSEVAS